MAADPGPESGFGEALGTALGKHQCPRVAGWLSGCMWGLVQRGGNRDPAPGGGQRPEKSRAGSLEPRSPTEYSRGPFSNPNRDPVASEDPATAEALGGGQSVSLHVQLSAFMCEQTFDVLENEKENVLQHLGKRSCLWGKKKETLSQRSGVTPWVGCAEVVAAPATRRLQVSSTQKHA